LTPKIIALKFGLAGVSGPVARRQYGATQIGIAGKPWRLIGDYAEIVNEDFLLALAEHFDREGPKVIARLARDQPAAYMKICALLVPKELTVEHSAGVESLTDEQLDAAIGAIREMLARRACEEPKAIEGTAEATALPAPTELEQPRRKRSNRLLEHADTALSPSERRKRKPQ
jgi:hypothetical protein